MGSVVTKQEQQPAREEVDEVAPGVLRVQLAIDFPGLGHVNCYALEDGEGFALVDPGMPGPTSYKELQRGLDRAGIPIQRVHTAFVTHSHPDHFGGAAFLREQSGADIVTHTSFRMFWEPTEQEGDDPEVGDIPASPWDRPTPWGTAAFHPESSGAVHDEMREHMRARLGIPRPTRRLADADRITLARREWVAVHTPGHTADHLCLYDEECGVVLSGDHVLPTITPHISGLGAGEDPLAEFFGSLERMRRLGNVNVVLPAHGLDFDDLNGRVTDIERHHEERLERLRTAAAGIGEPASVHELMKHLFSERAWGPMAESETYAHLEHLRLLGQATSERRDGLLYYAIP
jgi:glyoxylase-like metal-dependent hydrolase (beta-lactamase superfamily II)